MHSSILWLIALGTLLVVAEQPTRTTKVDTRDDLNVLSPRSDVAASPSSSPSPNDFVTIKDGEFTVNGSKFQFVGTNAYWLAALNSDEDIDNTLGNMSAVGIKVVRTWAFNDVEKIPENGTWFQLIANGTTTVNNGTNGLQKLDKVMELADKHGLFVILALTNNWNPHVNDTLNITAPLDPSPDIFRRDNINNATNTTRTRNTLSNDYGGMDAYVRNFGGDQHDSFFSNDTLINAFKNYTSQIIARYVNNTRLFSWEIANDARCNSTISTSSGCVTQNVTRWHSNIAQHIQSMDPNHLISSGTHGFMCPDCVKLFPTNTPRPSPAPVNNRRAIPKPFTKRRFLEERKKKVASAPRTTGHNVTVGSGETRIRGRWITTPTKRQQDVNQIGSALDGSHGVDSEDIGNIPQIGFNTFQLFPDQNSYGVPNPALSAFNNTLQIGLEWIKLQAQLGLALGKPVIMSSFGLVTQNNSQAFVPFNTSIAPFATQTGTSQPAQPSQSGGTSQVTFGVTDKERDQAYGQWLNTGIANGLAGMLQYQWGQPGLTALPGTPIGPIGINESGQEPNQNTSGVSPNDGYTTQGGDVQSVQNVISAAAQAVAANSGA